MWDKRVWSSKNWRQLLLTTLSSIVVQVSLFRKCLSVYLISSLYIIIWSCFMCFQENINHPLSFWTTRQEHLYISRTICDVFFVNSYATNFIWATTLKVSMLVILESPDKRCGITSSGGWPDDGCYRSRLERLLPVSQLNPQYELWVQNWSNVYPNPFMSKRVDFVTSTCWCYSNGVGTSSWLQNV